MDVTDLSDEHKRYIKQTDTPDWYAVEVYSNRPVGTDGGILLDGVEMKGVTRWTVEAGVGGVNKVTVTFYAKSVNRRLE